MKTRITRSTFAAPVAFNRDFTPTEDGWIQLYPFGEFPGHAIVPGEDPLPIVQVLDKEAAAAHLENFAAGQLVDFEHFSHEPDKETRAAGWLEEIEIRDDGLYGRIRWSTSGKTAIEGGDYRYLSPEFEKLEPLGEDRYRPRALTGAGLTNRPALKKIRPITNRFEPANQPKPKTQMLEKLIKILGLADDASEEAVIEAVSKTHDLAASAKETAEERDTLLEDLAEADIEQFADVVDEEEKEEVKKMLVQNRDGTRKILAAAQAKLRAGGEGKGKSGGDVPPRLYNRGAAKPPASVIAKENAAADARAGKVRNRALEIQRTEKIAFADAWSRADAEIPAAE